MRGEPRAALAVFPRERVNGVGPACGGLLFLIGAAARRSAFAAPLRGVPFSLEQRFTPHRPVKCASRPFGMPQAAHLTGR